MTIYWLFLVFFLFGILVSVLFLKTGVKQYFSRQLAKIIIVKGYWKFISLFSVVVILAYYLILNYIEDALINRYLDILGNMSTLIFGIFVGYFAFLQVAESRKENLKEESFRYIKAGSPTRARDCCENVYKIDPEDFINLGNLLEIYLVLSHYSSFDEKIGELEKGVKDRQDEILVYFLKTAKFVLQGHMNEVKYEIKNCVDFVKKYPDLLGKFSWDFNDIKKSESYTKLEVNSDAKRIFENFIEYLKRNLDESKKGKFENGDYTLRD